MGNDSLEGSIDNFGQNNIFEDLIFLNNFDVYRMSVSSQIIIQKQKTAKIKITKYWTPMRIS